MSTITQQHAGRVALSCGGTASAIIDFSDDGMEPGGHDPGVPQILLSIQVRGYLRIGHTWDADHPDAPIWIWESDDVTDPRTRSTDLRCPGCVASPRLGHLEDFTLAILTHRAGCRWLTGRLRESGLAA